MAAFPPELWEVVPAATATVDAHPHRGRWRRPSCPVDEFSSSAVLAEPSPVGSVSCSQL